MKICLASLHHLSVLCPYSSSPASRGWSSRKSHKVCPARVAFSSLVVLAVPAFGVRDGGIILLNFDSPGDDGALILLDEEVLRNRVAGKEGATQGDTTRPALAVGRPTNW